MIKNRKAIIVGIKSTILSKKEKFFLNKYKPWGVILFSRNLKKFKQIQKTMAWPTYWESRSNYYYWKKRNTRKR